MNTNEKITEWSYWKAVVRYVHVGEGKEISVARYLVMAIITEMSGTKNVPSVQF